MLLGDRFADVGLVCPEADTVGAFASEDDGDAGAPCACADDGDFAHACFDPKAVFGAGEKSADVGMVLDDDEHRRGCHRK